MFGSPGCLGTVGLAATKSCKVWDQQEIQAVSTAHCIRHADIVTCHLQKAMVGPSYLTNGPSVWKARFVVAEGSILLSREACLFLLQPTPLPWSSGWQRQGSRGQRAAIAARQLLQPLDTSWHSFRPGQCPRCSGICNATSTSGWSTAAATTLGCSTHYSQPSVPYQDASIRLAIF